VRQIHGSIKAQRQVTYTTVMTVCVRLAKKGLLNREKPEQGLSYMYSPSIGEREFVSCMVADILDAVVRDYPSALALYLETRRELSEAP
jgi:predicted transcriptional regulator